VTSEFEGEQQSRIEEDWKMFNSLTSMINHWDRPGWSPGRRAYYWYLTFDSTDLRALAARCQASLPTTYLDHVPLDGLHLTLPKVGWADELTEDQIEQVVRAATQDVALFPRFELEVGPLAGSSGAVRFSVNPWDPVNSLFATLSRAGRDNTGLNFDNSFRPHIGIAYCNAAIDATDLIATVRELRSLPPVRIEITEVELVLLERRGRSYAWSLQHSIPLASTSNQSSASIGR
jgi:2'-5' RNA ligase